jgi:uncharacterized protein
MRYWIDGYNLLFRLPLTKESLANKRKRVILDLNEQAELLSLDITIIFDAEDQERNLDRRSHYRSLEIIYSTSKQTADESILDSIECSYHPEKICVVTSDKDLSYKAKVLRANTLSLKEFFLFIAKKQKKKSATSYIECTDSPREIARLLKIFEKKLEEQN